MIPPKQILDQFGNPASATPRAEQLHPVWRRSMVQQNMSAGEFLRDSRTGKYLRDVSTGKYKRATAGSDCADCGCVVQCCDMCEPAGTGTGSSSDITKGRCCLKVTISGTGVCDVCQEEVLRISGDSIDGVYYLQSGLQYISCAGPATPSCSWGLRIPSPIVYCNTVDSGCTGGFDSLAFDTLFLTVCNLSAPGTFGEWVVSVGIDPCGGFGGSGPVSKSDTVGFCGGLVSSFSITSTTPACGGLPAQFVGFPITFLLEWATQAECDSQTKGCGPGTACGGTGTGTGTSPCDCPGTGTGTGNCDDTALALSVNMDALKTCDPDLLGMIVNVPRISTCPTVEYQADFYFGNRHIDITYSAGCYNLSVTQSFPISRTIFHGYSSTLTGTYTYCDGDCTTSPTVGAESCPSNCSTQCGDCTQLGTTFSFIAPVSGQLRLIYNDQYGSFYNNSGSFSVVFTTGDTGTYTCDGTATNGSPGPAVVAGTTYAGTASGVCFWDVTAPCSSNADGVIQSGSNPGCTTVGGTDCSSLTFGSLVAQICTAADIYCDGICDDSASSVSIDTSAFNDGICTSSNTDSASLSGTCLSGTIVWTGTFGVITYNQSCYTLTLTFLCGTWVGTCCTPTGIYCQISDSTGKNPTNVEVS